MDLTLDQLYKVNEYRTIKATLQEFYMEEQELKSNIPNR